MNRESGQVTVFAALMLIVFVGVAAFCMNAAYAFHQHTQMQAQIDSSVLYAAGTGCPTTSTGTVSTGTVKIQSPPGFGPYSNNKRYCGGTYTKPGTSLFGKIVPAWFPISVQAVALHGATSEPYFSLLGLSTVGDSHGCSIYFQDASEVVNITGDSYSNSPMDAATCKDVAPPAGNITYTGGSYHSASNFYDPFRQPVLVSGRFVASASPGPYSDSCGDVVNSGEKYYQPTSPTDVIEITDIQTSNTVYNFLPYCLSGNKSAGTYLIDNRIKLSSSGVINSIDSTFVLSTTAYLDMTGGTINWNESLDGEYTGDVLYEDATLPCSSIQTIGFSGGGTQIINGLIDTECGSLTFAGGATYDINGTIVADTITFAGSTTGKAVVKAPPVPPLRGAFLVQ